MICYSKSHVRMAEVYYRPLRDLPAVDVARSYFQEAPAAEGHNTPFHTLLIDLTPEPDAIFAGFQARLRTDLRNTMKGPSETEYQRHPSKEWLQEFFAFYDRFAATRGLKPANRERLGAMHDARQLDLSRANAGDETLVWHCHLRVPGHARLMHSASLFRDSDKEHSKLTGRMNKLLHWRDMLQYRGEGVCTYDFGGWYAGQDDETLLGINRFKETFGGQVKQLFNVERAYTLRGRLAIHAVRQLERWRQGRTRS